MIGRAGRKKRPGKPFHKQVLTDEQIEQASNDMEQAITGVLEEYGLPAETDRGMIRTSFKDKEGTEYDSSWDPSIVQG